MLSDTSKHFKVVHPVIPDSFLERWQSIADIAAKIINVPSGLIMRVHEKTIEVFVSSNTPGTPYTQGAKEELNSGLYCETVISEREKLLVPNALEDPDWDKNPDIKLGMISYLGFPLYWPDDEAFGTICVLDNKENGYNELHVELLARLRDTIEGDLRNLYRIEQLSKALEQINELEKIVPICSKCKKVKNDSNYWEQVEDYLLKHRGLKFTHSLCTECAESYKKELEQDMGEMKKERR